MSQKKDESLSRIHEALTADDKRKLASRFKMTVQGIGKHLRGEVEKPNPDILMAAARLAAKRIEKQKQLEKQFKNLAA